MNQKIGKIKVPILRLAWIEFSLPFRHLRSGVPGGRDFLWLTLLLTLVLTLGLLLQATRIGLLERFVDVFLGSVEGHGVPVWVIPNPVSRGSIKFISNNVIDEVQNEGLKIFPYREVDAGFDKVELPGAGVWRTQSELEPKFSGWAVYINDPLWPETVAEVGSLPLKIVISRTLFQKHFDYQRYNEVVGQLLPEAIFSELTQKRFESQRPLDHIWLNIRAGDRTSLNKFEVTWVDRIPTIRNIAFLFPMPTYHALQEAANYPELRYFPEYQGANGLRLKKILIANDIQPEKFDNFLAATKGTASKRRGKTIVNFETPQQTILIKSLLANLGSTFRHLEDVEGHRIIDLQTHIELPCGTVTKRDLKKLNPKTNGNAGCRVRKNVTSAGNGFLRAFVYVPDRTNLNNAVKRSLEIHNKALSIHPIYQDALNRFGFLTKIIDALRWPYGIILFLFLIAVLGIQIGTLVDHRRSRYGIFLAKGLSWGELYQMLYLQISFAIVIGALSAFVITSALKQVVASIIAETTDQFQDAISITNFEILPLSLTDYVFVTLGALALAQCFATFILFRLSIHPRTEIGPLLQS